jgi:hypothetical protein
METMESLSERLEALENQICAVKRRLHCSATLLLAALVVYALAPARLGQAADFSCSNGDVACLITAINMANANGDANTITLKAGTYTLTAVDNFTGGGNGLPVVTSPLTITGREAKTTIIESAGAGRILNVAAAGTLTLQGLTLRNGGSVSVNVAFPGGGIFNSGTLTVIDCILTRNGASSGGGLFNNGGTVTINHTTFDGNEGGPGGSGGGLSNGFRSFNEGGTVTIANSTFVHNIANDSGGLANFNMGTMTLTNTTVAQNRAANGAGGGILNANAIMLLQSSTVAENHGSLAGAGGIAAGGIVLLQNTIIARNDTSPPPFPPFGGGPVASDCSGPITSLGNNLIGDPTATGCTITLEPSDLTADPGLDTFTDNGTPGNGHFPLLSTSQAIDAGNNAVCFRTDQLGERRIGRCDIGAITFQGKDDRRHEKEDFAKGFTGP